MKTKTKIITGMVTVMVLIIGGWFTWNYIIPSQDFFQSVKDMRADAAGLERTITHTMYDGSKKSWECKTKIYPFPTETGTGAAFSFIDDSGKKVICGPGWRIEEK